MTALSSAERKRREHARKRACGMVQVSVWVPADRAFEVRALAAAFPRPVVVVPGQLPLPLSQRPPMSGELASPGPSDF